MHQVKEIFLDPLSDFDHKKLKGTWLYKKKNPFPARIPAFDASPLLPVVIDESQEVIIRDKATNKVILAVYRDRLGPDALEIMQGTVTEMMQI